MDTSVEGTVTYMATTGKSNSLTDLLALDGVIAAGEFAADGEVRDFEADIEMSDQLAEMTAQYCATVTMLFDTLAGAFTQLSGMNWAPQQGWMYAGGDYTVAIGGQQGVFAETDKTDLNELYAALVGAR